MRVTLEDLYNGKIVRQVSRDSFIVKDAVTIREASDAESAVRNARTK